MAVSSFFAALRALAGCRITAAVLLIFCVGTGALCAQSWPVYVSASPAQFSAGDTITLHIAVGNANHVIENVSALQIEIAFDGFKIDPLYPSNPSLQADSWLLNDGNWSSDVQRDSTGMFIQVSRDDEALRSGHGYVVSSGVVVSITDVAKTPFTLTGRLSAARAQQEIPVWRREGSGLMIEQAPGYTARLMTAQGQVIQLMDVSQGSGYVYTGAWSGQLLLLEIAGRGNRRVYKLIP